MLQETQSAVVAACTWHAVRLHVHVCSIYGEFQAVKSQQGRRWGHVHGHVPDSCTATRCGAVDRAVRAYVAAVAQFNSLLQHVCSRRWRYAQRV